MGRKPPIRICISFFFVVSFFACVCSTPSYATIITPEPPAPPSATTTDSGRDTDSSSISDSYKLKTITVNGQQIENFDKDKQDYTYYMSSGEEAVLSAELTKAVTGTPFNIQAEVIETLDGNVVKLYVSAGSAPNGLTYTVTFLKMVSKEDSGLIIRENRYLVEITNARMTVNELKNRAVDSVNTIATELKRIDNPDEAEKAYAELQETITALIPIVEKTKSDSEVLQAIGEMTDAARNLVKRIAGNEKVTEQTIGYFNKMNSLLKKADMSGPAGSKLKNCIHDLGIEAVHRTGTLKAENSQFSLNGEKATISFSQAEIAGHLVKAKANYSKIASAMNSLLGSNNPRKLEYGISLKADRTQSMTSMDTTLAKSILESLLKDGVEKLELQMGEAALAFKPGILTAEDKSLKFSVLYASPTTAKLPPKTFIVPGSLVVDISLASDVGLKENFESPALLSIDMTEADLKGYSEKSMKGLGLFRMNEVSGNWMPVGGNYDPITQVIKTFRLHLSKYTVLKTDKSFSDVQNSWAKDDINELLNKGVVKEEVAFAPKGDLSREEFARWVAKAYGLEASGKTLPFKDITKSHPYYNELAAAYSQGIIKGRSDTTFDPNGKITRQEMATLITNVLVKYEKAKVDSSLTAKLIKYSDNKKIAPWARDNVAMVNELGIMQGDSRGFRPTDYISREEAASLFKRIYN